jgi:uridylate kinase
MSVRRREASPFDGESLFTGQRRPPGMASEKRNVYGTELLTCSADPETSADARKFERLSAGDLVDVIADVEMSAGASAPVDLLAAKLIERSGTRTIVLDGTDPERIERAVHTGEHGGTDIVPEGSNDEPTYWVDG